MTKAERDEIRALAGETEWEIYARKATPIHCSLNDLLDQIDALEAQLAQKDERILQLQKHHQAIHASCNKMRMHDETLDDDAKEGEGK